MCCPKRKKTRMQVQHKVQHLHVSARASHVMLVRKYWMELLHCVNDRLLQKEINKGLGFCCYWRPWDAETFSCWFLYQAKLPHLFNRVNLKEFQLLVLLKKKTIIMLARLLSLKALQSLLVGGNKGSYYVTM